MDKIEKLGWPYNLYSAITGQSVPDAEYMKTRIYRYKYQRGYYCFFMINPIDASKYISKYLINYINRPYYTIYHASNEYRTSLKYYYEQLHDIFMYMVLLHKYAYGRPYKEIINIFYKDVDTFESCLSDASFF